MTPSFPGSERELARIIRDELSYRSILSMGRTAPNPPVACVVELPSGGAHAGGEERGASLLFSGGTEVPGGRHAEIVALDSLDRYLSTLSHSLHSPWRLHVTLEPCSKQGRTPPCTSRIVQYDSIGELVIHTPDPTLAGEGKRILQEARKRVLPLSGESEGGEFRPDDAFLRGFLQRVTGGGPRLHLKVALTCDGYMGHVDRRISISGGMARRFTMSLRAKLDAVLVGPGTVAIDRPGLDLRINPEIMGEGALQGFTRHWAMEGVDPEEGVASLGNALSCGALAWKERRIPRLEGADLFTDSLFRYQKELEELALREGESFQPDRIFFLGRPFAGMEPFFLKQRELGVRTGRAPRYCTTRKYLPFWKEHPLLAEGEKPEILPDLKDSSFGEDLRAYLSHRGYNEVLVEGGSILFESLENRLLSTDRLYIVQSRERTLQEPPASLKTIPPSFREMTSLARYDLGSDLLTVHGAR